MWRGTETEQKKGMRQNDERREGIEPNDAFYGFRCLSRSLRVHVSIK